MYKAVAELPDSGSAKLLNPKPLQPLSANLTLEKLRFQALYEEVNTFAFFEVEVAPSISSTQTAGTLASMFAWSWADREPTLNCQTLLFGRFLL